MDRRRHPNRISEHRAAIAWLLHGAGATYSAIGRGLGINPGRVRQLERYTESQIMRDAREEQRRPTLAATQRLIAAGALRPDSSRLSPFVQIPDIDELPPMDED